MGRPPLVLPALLVLLVSAVRAGRASRLPSRLQLDQLEQTRLDEPRLQRPRLDEPRLEDGARRLEDEPLVLAEPPRQPWTAGRGSHHRGETDRQQAGSSERLAHSRHRKRKRPSDEFQMFLRSRDSTCPRSSRGEEERFFCASQNSSGERVCVSQASLCDGKPDCPDGDDEHPIGCLFYKALSRNLDKISDKVLQLIHRNRLR